METGLTRRRITDYVVAKEFITQPCLFATIADDGETADNYQPDVLNNYFLGIYHGDELIAIYIFKQINSATIDCHANIPKRYRRDYSTLCGVEAYNWFLETEFLKMQATVPEIYQNVVDYLERFGWKREGRLRQSCMRNGKIIDMIMLGITKNEVARWLK